MSKVKGLQRRCQYLISRTETGSGVSKSFLLRFKNDVLDTLGEKAFDYLESSLHEKHWESWEIHDPTWEVYGSFSWRELESRGE